MVASETIIKSMCIDRRDVQSVHVYANRIERFDLNLRCRDGWTSILLGSHLYPPTRSYQ